jgi:hypothetical protein
MMGLRRPVRPDVGDEQAGAEPGASMKIVR